MAESMRALRTETRSGSSENSVESFSSFVCVRMKRRSSTMKHKHPIERKGFKLGCLSDVDKIVLIYLFIPALNEQIKLTPGKQRE